MLREIKELTLEIKAMQARLDNMKREVFETFDNMSKEDMALSDGAMIGSGIKIQYYPESTHKRVDTKLLKADGIYDNYVTETVRKAHIRVNVNEK